MSTWRTLSLLALLGSWYQMIEACNSCGSCLHPPAFISNFTTMRAQSNTESKLTIDHNLGEVPVKVEVQVRPSPGRSDREYVFPGLGSTQADDDLSLTYGGVVYKYNAQGTFWIGPKFQQEATAEVRVKLWTNCTFPAPDFESSWIPMSSETASSSYIEVEHALGEDPEYVSVQVKNFTSDWYSDGIGSSTKRQLSTTHWGGVLYGTNSTHVRIWTPYKNQGKIFSATDGWGIAEVWTSGLIKVRVWGTFGGNLVYNSTTPINSGLNPAGHQIHTPSLDIESGLIDVKVKVRDGLNNGFYFPASGAVQNAQRDEPYGGVVFSYSENGVRFWHPHLTRMAIIRQNYLVYIDSNWGKGIDPQASTSGDLVIRFWNLTEDGNGELC